MDPSTLPALNIRVDQLLFDKLPAMSIQAQLRPTAAGSAIKHFAINNKLYQISGSGLWTKKQTQLSGDFDSKKLDQVLQSFSLPAFILADQTKLKFNFSWPGAPWQVSFKQLSGQLTANLEHGSLPDAGSDNAASIGFGKILNLLSINSLPEHLSLNFSDIAAKGFSFNSLEGEFNLGQGTIKVPKLVIKGGSADVKSHGCIDLSQERYQLVMEVKPHLTSGLPIIAALAAGPIIGAVSLVANAIISPTISNITSSTYLLTGPWATPVNLPYPSDKAASAALRC